MNSETFAQKTAQGLVLVDFYADWCGPCKLLAPVLKTLEQEFGEQIKFVKVDVQQDQDLAVANNVMSIPTMLLFVDGVAKEKLAGYKYLADMRQYLTSKLEQYS
ncbi:thioredoxin [Ligilactobacillus murinus]|uniref:thioredoxin n=1 Tax=Ligilactobacillus murinus TaxID=1622 RepID=UPI001C8CAFD9|nr:thioredoxin [Ligilactobacillus murinus]MBX9013112.1 thioredoxin [Ligilactobacillus murinus]